MPLGHVGQLWLMLKVVRLSDGCWFELWLRPHVKVQDTETQTVAAGCSISVYVWVSDKQAGLKPPHH